MSLAIPSAPHPLAPTPADAQDTGAPGRGGAIFTAIVLAPGLVLAFAGVAALGLALVKVVTGEGF
jgi:hypothetical protein